MNLILLEPGELDEKHCAARVEGRRFDHMVQIQGVRVGDAVKVGVVDGCIGEARVLDIQDCYLDLEWDLQEEPPPPRPLTAIIALPRPLILKRLLHSLTTLGVKEIVLVGARKVERSFWNSRALRPGAIREQLILGLEQAVDTRLPQVSLAPYFRPFLETDLPRLTQGVRCLLADPAAETACPRGVSERLLLAVGPEGGFNAFEVEQFVERGFERVHLGDRVLRVDVAVTAAVARLGT